MFPSHTSIPKSLLDQTEHFMEQDVFAYSLKINKELNFSLKNTRKIAPFKGRLYVDSLKYPAYILRRTKTGGLLSTKIKVNSSSKPSLKLFLTLEEMVEEYEKDLLIVKNSRDELMKSYLDLEKECSDNLQILLEQ